MVQVPLYSTVCTASSYGAIAFVTGPKNVSGVVEFQQQGDRIKIHGLTPNAKHGFHVHEFGDLSGGCDTTGAHFNPFHHDHGAPSDDNRHIGDLGNILADSKGTAVIDVKDCLVRLCGEHSVIGRGIVVHEGTDDLGRGGHDDSKTTGHAGARAGCGVIAHAPALGLD